MTAQNLIADLRSRINPAYENTPGTESHERRLCAEALEALLAALEWHPIKTAPRNKRVLVWSGQEMYCAHWAQHPMTGDEAWIVAEWGNQGDQALVRPTHWMQLPDAPNASPCGPRTAVEETTGVSPRPVEGTVIRKGHHDPANQKKTDRHGSDLLDISSA